MQNRKYNCYHLTAKIVIHAIAMDKNATKIINAQETGVNTSSKRRTIPDKHVNVKLMTKRITRQRTLTKIHVNTTQRVRLRVHIQKMAMGCHISSRAAGQQSAIQWIPLFHFQTRSETFLGRVWIWRRPWTRQEKSEF
jgi:hypothetical protein